MYTYDAFTHKARVPKYEIGNLNPPVRSPTLAPLLDNAL